ncbi:hypothetical protein CXB51_019867 [Gossypium anomalum]|uniref:Protein SirB1 N-terminal domain-containing protein n=1 Tax=Gossypium anomalum TaxID=47600 RepID=A0A8J6CWX2_9ROSI|nr:hypothetical protein CXB51_019867 [Gossypium anomalum]
MLCTVYCMPAASMVSQTFAADHFFIRYDHHHHHDHKDLRRWRSRTTAAASAYPLFSNPKDSSSRHKFYQEALKTARDKFAREISFQSEDKDVSLAKALLYVAAEDETFMVFNREMDACSFLNEGINVCSSSNAREWDSVEQMPLDGKTISEWLSELDAIAKEVEAELVSRDIGCHLVEVLQAVNLVLFELRGFKRSPVLVDSKHSYLHFVLSSGCGSAILLSIIYIEVCRWLGLTIVGSRVGEDFLIWPQTTYPEDTACSLLSMEGVLRTLDQWHPIELIASNRDIVGIALANLIRFHWKRASRSNLGLMLTSPLRHAHNADEKPNKIDKPNVPLLRPQDHKLAIMASERLLILQPHNWALRRDHGMMLYYNREYGKAVQELSICMAFAPEEEAELLEPFVEKLHLMRLESSWKSLGHTASVTVK